MAVLRTGIGVGDIVGTITKGGKDESDGGDCEYPVISGSDRRCHLEFSTSFFASWMRGLVHKGVHIMLDIYVLAGKEGTRPLATNCTRLVSRPGSQHWNQPSMKNSDSFVRNRSWLDPSNPGAPQKTGPRPDLGLPSGR